MTKVCLFCGHWGGTTPQRILRAFCGSAIITNIRDVPVTLGPIFEQLGPRKPNKPIPRVDCGVCLQMTCHTAFIES